MASGTFEIFNDSSLGIDGIRDITLHKTISLIFADFDKTMGWINVIFLDSVPHTSLNINHLNHDYETDVLTFDFSEYECVNGEIYINAEVAKDNADYYKESFQNELNRLIIHGVLHLVGINDKTASEQKIMRDLEDKYLKCFM